MGVGLWGEGERGPSFAFIHSQEGTEEEFPICTYHQNYILDVFDEFNYIYIKSSIPFSPLSTSE